MIDARRHGLRLLLSPCSLSPRGPPWPPTTIPSRPIRLIVAVGGRRSDRSAGAARVADPHRQARPACRGRKSAGRGRRARRPFGRQRAAGRLHAADGQHQHAGGDPSGVDQRGLRSGQGLHADRPHDRGLPDPGGASVVAWQTVKDFVADAKANPGKINYAHTGAGGLPHLAGELFMLRSGIKLTGVSYRSGGEANTAVLARTCRPRSRTSRSCAT